MQTLRVSLLPFLFLPFVACTQAVDVDSEESGVPPSFAETQDSLSNAEEIARVDIPTGYVAFYVMRDGAEETLAYLEAGRMGFAQTPLATLIAERRLTTLEVYRALTDEPAPEIIESLHVREASDLGRDDASVQEIELDLHALVDKISEARCDDIVFIPSSAYRYLNKRRWDNGSNSRMFTMGPGGNEPAADFDYKTTRDVTLGACNDGNTTITASIAWGILPDGRIISRGSFSLDPGWWGRWWGLHKNSYSCSSSGGFTICTPNPLNYFITVSGNSLANYHVRTAEMVEVVR
jgi:hypothetical protein